MMFCCVLAVLVVIVLVAVGSLFYHLVPLRHVRRTKKILFLFL